MNIALFATAHQAGRVKGLGALLVVFVMLGALLPANALAVVSPFVTPATGGSTISADTAVASPGTGAYSALTGPVVTEIVAGDLAAGTIVLDAPSGFEFRAGFGTAGKNAGCNLVLASVTTISTSVTLTMTGTSSTTACVITFSGIQVRPTVGTPLQNGNISNSGTTGPGGNWGTLTEVVGAPVLSFQTQPSGTAAAATAFAQQPVVLDVDRFGNTRSGDSITLSITAGTGAVGAVLSCTTNPVVTNGSGVATFAGCKIDKSSPSAYTLRATSSAGGTAAVSSGVAVTPGIATHLAFTVQPARGIPGTAFAVQPSVSVLDAGNNVVYTDSGRSVTLAILANPGSGTLTCTANPASTASGVANFAGCRISTVGVGYTLQATASGLTLANSSAFDVADRLLFTTQPSGATAGTAFTTQPVVAVKAGPTNTAVNDSSTVVTLSLKAGTGAVGAALTCDTSLARTVVAGVAIFTGCKIDKVSPVSPANPYVIVASASGLTSAESATIAVNPGVATKLGFTAQPTSASSNQAFPIQPVVAVQDPGGNTVTSGTNSNATITLAIGTNPAAGTLTCTGGLTKVAVAGVATFVGCQINNAGVGYTLTATAIGLTGATSTPFTVGAPAATITLATSASVITWASGIVLTTRFSANGASRSFQLQATRDGVTWGTITTLTTDAFGSSTFAYRPATNNWYRVVFAGAADLSAATSPTVRTVVRQIALLRPTNGGHVKSIARNTSITFTTTVRPARPELAPAKVSFYFYRQVGSSWVLKAKRDVYINAAGLARTTFKFTSSGQWYVRSAANPTTYNANSIPSPRERYSVF
jgi:hypothetical protein